MATLPELDGVTRRSIAKHVHALRQGFHAWQTGTLGLPPAMGDPRWPAELILATWAQAENGQPPTNGFEHRVGRSGGGFDALEFVFPPPERWLRETATISTSLSLNRRADGRRIEIPIPWYGAGMSYGSVSEQVMLARARTAELWGTFTSTGEGGYPRSLYPYRDHVITQVATGMFGVREETIAWAPIVELKYAQGAKPGLGGHLREEHRAPTGLGQEHAVLAQDDVVGAAHRAHRSFLSLGAERTRSLSEGHAGRPAAARHH
jgi:hypothetical protein